jgi:glycosyltransferase involved in cell wall biosynthesis
MRIGLVTDCYVPQVGGIEMQVHDLAQRLQLAGHEVVVITSMRGPDVVDGVRVRRLDVPLLPFNIPFAPKTFRLVADDLERERVDVAHFHGGIVSPLAYGAAYRAQRQGIPSVVTTHCLWSYATPAFETLDRLVRWTEWDVVLSAVSDLAAEPLRRVAGPGRPVLVLPNGIDHAAWDVEPEPADGRPVTIVSVMRLAPRKRPLHLLRMLKQVHERLPHTDVRTVVIGEGPERSSLERYLAASGMEDRVTLLGRRSRDQIREQFARSDLFVAPANLESFGIAALEARCAGLPVVAKERTGIREFVEHGREGLLAASDRDMVDQIVHLVRDRELRLLISKNNRETRAPVDWSEVVGRNVAAYELAASGADVRSVGPRRGPRPARVARRATP